MASQFLRHFSRKGMSSHMQIHRIISFMHQICQAMDGYVRYCRPAKQLLFILTVVSVSLRLTILFSCFYSYCRDFSPTLPLVVPSVNVSFFSIRILIQFVLKKQNAECFRQAQSFLPASKRCRCLITAKAVENCSMRLEYDLEIQ